MSVIMVPDNPLLCQIDFVVRNPGSGDLFANALRDETSVTALVPL